ncbi:MAG: PAS domain S-box protein [Verrucomicrobiales bacterium]|nr:PAS domain S-box protein [Verrucomicrobiales bacterium]
MNKDSARIREGFGQVEAVPVTGSNSSPGATLPPSADFHWSAEWRRLGILSLMGVVVVWGVLMFFPGRLATSAAVLLSASFAAYAAHAVTRPLRRQAAELRASEERNRVIVESAQDAFVLMDSQGRIVQWNRQAEVIFGWPRAEVIGAILADTIVPVRYREAHQKGLDRFLQSGVGPVLSRTIEISALRRDGKEFPVELSISPIQVGEGFCFSAFLRDITARREAEELLRRSRDETELLLASLPAVVIVVDTRGQVVRWNPAAEHLFAIKASEVVGKHFFDAPIKWKWNLLRQAVIDCFAHSHPIELANVAFEKPNGKDGCLQLILSPSRQNDAAGLNFIVLGIDMTDHRLLEGQLRQAQKMESIGQLAAGIAHEINTPTQFIGDNLRFLKDGFSDLGSVVACLERMLQEAAAGGSISASELDAARTAVEQADLTYLMGEIPKAINQSLDGTDRVAKIVRAMKEFSHPSVDERKPIDLNRSIESTLTVARNEWKYVADLVLELGSDLPPVPCFPGDFNQVVLNLVVNAAHAIAETPAVKSGGKGKITVRTFLVDGWVEIQIQDTGMGIPAAIKDRIFDPFFTTKEVGKGTGQGLFIVHAVVSEKHGGRISFESTVGVGTTFKVQLPLRPQVNATNNTRAA